MGLHLHSGPLASTQMAEVTRRDALKLGALGLVAAGCGGSDGPRTRAAPITAPALPPFDDRRPDGPATGLPRRVAWANTSETEIFVALGNGIEQAAEEQGLDYLTAVAANDPARNVDQIETFLARGIGALAIQPLDPAAQRPVLQQALDRGICVHGIITHPCTLQVAAGQYLIGFQQGKAAADYAKAKLGGRADVHYFNQDSLSPQLRLRHEGVLAGLKTAGGGVRVVSDLSARESDGSIEGGFALMNTVMQRHPDIKIVLGSDTLVTGAYRALEQTGRLSDDMYLAGVDGDTNALALVEQDGPYRASSAFAWSLIGYGMGRFAADWIAGREVPRVMVAESVLLDSPAKVDRYRADNADPARVFADRAAYERYVPLLGNVSHATRDRVWREEYVPR